LRRAGNPRYEVVMLATFTRGNGKKHVLFLHGFLGSGRNLTSLAQRLSELRPDLTITVGDLPGHGASPPMIPPYALPALVEPTVRSVDVLPAPLVIAGHSMGGRVAIEAAVARPARVAQVILIDIAPGPIGDRNKDLESVARALVAAPATAQSRGEMRDHLLATGLSNSLADWLLMNLVNDGAGTLRWRIDRAALLEFGKASRSDDLWADAEAVAAKLQVVYGSRSGFVTDDDRARLRAMGVAPHPLDAGHFVHVEALEPLAAWLGATIA
jgi:pimeloyl-ACP methyl ester carboxylesterase